MNHAARNWYAVYVQSRCEFVAEIQLLKQGMECYLPSVAKVSQWKDRKKLLNVPLFPSYLFVRVTPDPRELTHVLKTHGVVCLLGPKQSSPTPISQDEIHYLRALIDSGKNLTVSPNLKKGVSVRIKNGPLEGVTGVLKTGEPDNKCQFAVNIEILGRSVSVRVRHEEIEPA